MRSTAVISNLQHFSTGDGPGIRTTVFFQGCNLSCRWCHNPESLPAGPVLLYYKNLCVNCGSCARACPNIAHAFNGKSHTFHRERCKSSGECTKICPAEALKQSGKTLSVEQVFDDICADIDFYKESGGGVTFSGGEPLLQADFCAELAEKCRSNGLSVIVDTAGNVAYSELEKLLPYDVHFYFDLKAGNEEDYKTYTGGSFDLSVRNLSGLVAEGARVTARIPIIPNLSDNVGYCQKLSAILKKTGAKTVHLLPFHRFGSSKYTALGKDYPYKDARTPSNEHMETLLSVFRNDFDAKIDG